MSITSDSRHTYNEIMFLDYSVGLIAAETMLMRGWEYGIVMELLPRVPQ